MNTTTHAPGHQVCGFLLSIHPGLEMPRSLYFNISTNHFTKSLRNLWELAGSVNTIFPAENNQRLSKMENKLEKLKMGIFLNLLTAPLKIHSKMHPSGGIHN